MRPARYLVTNDGYLILASEVGALPIPPERIVRKSRLQPGKMLLVDTRTGTVLEDRELKHRYAAEHPYGEWLDAHLVYLRDLPIPNRRVERSSQERRDRLYKAFGYTYEEVKDAILPMARGGAEPTSAMGVDTPLAVLSEKHQPLFSYFKQLFAQVTNPPIDAIREEVVTDTTVYLGNDANCAAIGEYWAGAAKDCDPAVVVTLGTGIGGGLVVGGKLYTGFAQSGLEVGHMIIRPNGVLCGCGNRGCWEQYGSATALIRIAQEAMERDPGSVMWELCQGDRFRVDGRIPFQAARLGDLSAKKVLHRYLEGLSIGLINLVNILQPEIICLGGGISNAEDDLLLDPLRGLVLAGCFDKSKPPRLERASLGNDAGVVGAAMLYKML